MITLRYTQWDGTQRVRLNADQVFRNDHRLGPRPETCDAFLCVSAPLW